MNNFADIVLDNPLISSDDTALVDRNRRVSYTQLKSNVLGVAAFLRTRGLTRGDRAAILMSNCVEFIEIYLGCAAAGVVVVPLNTRQLQSEQESLLKDAGVRVLFTSEQYRERGLHFLDSLEELNALVETGPIHDSSGIWSYERIREASGPLDVERTSKDGPAAILYTSGTTSAPKGAVITHGNLLADLEQYITTTQLVPKGVNLQLSPLFHAAAVFSFAHLKLGGKTILIEKVDPNLILSTIEKEKVSFIFTVPTVLYQLLDHQDRAKSDLSSLKRIQYGAAPISGARLSQAIDVFGYRLMHSYGATESTSHISILGCEEHKFAEGSVGRPLSGVEVRIVDDTNAELEPDTVGEILVRGRNVFAGYWQRPEATSETLRNGWLHTGDLGRIDKRGFLYVVDRKKDMVISGGTNIYPKELEDVMIRHGGIAELAVFGIPDHHWGEAVAAAVVPKEGMTLSESELMDYMRSKVGGYKVPKVLKILSELPKNATGKILKRELAKMKIFR